jgi:hypothetical protein
MTYIYVWVPVCLCHHANSFSIIFMLKMFVLTMTAYSNGFVISLFYLLFIHGANWDSFWMVPWQQNMLKSNEWNKKATKTTYSTYKLHFNNTNTLLKSTKTTYSTYKLHFNNTNTLLKSTKTTYSTYKLHFNNTNTLLKSTKTLANLTEFIPHFKRPYWHQGFKMSCG